MRSSARRSTASSPAGTMARLQLYGYSPTEAMGRHASFLYPPGQRKRSTRSFAQVREGRPPERLETDAPAQGRRPGRRVGDLLADPRQAERDRRRLRHLPRHHPAGPGARRRSPTAKSGSACCSIRRRNRSTGSISAALHLLQCRVRPAARLRLPRRPDRQADAPADSPHPAGRLALSTGDVADLRGDASSRAGAHVARRGVLARRRHLVPGGVPEPSDPPAPTRSSARS